VILTGPQVEEHHLLSEGPKQHMVGYVYGGHGESAGW
jgi:hypothetical protein